MSRKVRVELTEAQARGLRAAAGATLSTYDLMPDGPERAAAVRGYVKLVDALNRGRRPNQRDDDRPCVMHPVDDCSATFPCVECPAKGTDQ